MKPTTLTRIAGAAVLAVGMTAAAQTRSNAPRPNPQGQAPSAQPASNQPGTRPNTQPNQPANPQNQPGAPGNNNPAMSNPNQSNPNRPGDRDPNRPGVQKGDPNAAGNSLLNRRQRLFRLADDNNVAQLNDFGTRMQRFETQMQDSNQRLMKQLGQARQLSGTRRDDALAEVLQGILQDQATLQQMLMDIRVSITGDLGDPGGSMAGAPNGDTIYDNPARNTGGTDQPGGSQQPRPSGPPR